MWIALGILAVLVLNGFARQSHSCRRPSRARLADGKPHPATTNLLTITDEFQKALDLMEHSTSCVYITGKAGTGKSTLLSYFRQKTHKRCVVLAPTGVAALTVKGATISAFFGFPPRLIEKRNIHFNADRQLLFRHLETIIIDEISMVGPDVMDGIDYSLRLHRQDIRPFGGVQMIFFGDLYQLPPVVSASLAAYFNTQFGGIYFFNSQVFKEIDFVFVELQTVFRQKEESFKLALNHIRENKVTAADLSLINKRYHPDYSALADEQSVTLTTTRRHAEAITQVKMADLAGAEYVFHAVIKGNVARSGYPAEEHLSLKLGTQVMLLKNDPLKRWVNGSLGVINQISEHSVSVEINGLPYPVERAVWEAIEYVYHPEHQRVVAIVVGTFCQFPVKAAWAITIHKSQGLTFDRVIIHWGTGAFAHGQAYVALSRCRSLEGLVLAQPLRKSDIILDEQVRQFLLAKAQVGESWQ